MTTASENVSVVHAPDRQRYEISIEGALAGFTEYRDRNNQRVFFHTEIDDAYAGHGLSGFLVTYALDDVRSAGRRVVGVCPLVAKYLRKHHEYDDLSDPVTPDTIEFIRGTT